MLAELNNKISKNGFNLSNRLEDQLTGDFFGNLRYLPFEKGMREILRRATPVWGKLDLDNELKQLGEIGEWHDRITFWPYDEEGEIDVVLTLDQLLIGIEVKYESGLSSVDEDNEESKTIKDSKNQLIREMRILRKRVKVNENPFMIFIARQESCQSICESVKKQYLEKQVPKHMNLYSLSWEDILETLKEIQHTKKLNCYEQVIIGDLIKLLEKKGFSIFKGFTLEQTLTVSKKKYFKFY